MSREIRKYPGKRAAGGKGGRVQAPAPSTAGTRGPGRAPRRPAAPRLSPRSARPRERAEGPRRAHSPRPRAPRAGILLPELRGPAPCRRGEHFRQKPLGAGPAAAEAGRQAEGAACPPWGAPGAPRWTPCCAEGVCVSCAPSGPPSGAPVPAAECCAPRGTQKIVTYLFLMNKLILIQWNRGKNYKDKSLTDFFFWLLKPVGEH